MTQKTKTIIGAGLILVITVAIFLFYWSKTTLAPVGGIRKESVVTEAEKEKIRMNTPEVTDLILSSGLGIVTEVNGGKLSIKTPKEELTLGFADGLVIYTIENDKTTMLSGKDLRKNDRIRFEYIQSSKKILSIMIVKE